MGTVYWLVQIVIIQQTNVQFQLGIDIKIKLKAQIHKCEKTEMVYEFSTWAIKGNKEIEKSDNIWNMLSLIPVRGNTQKYWRQI